MTTATQKIPTGYKQTDIGIIPTDWDVVTLSEVTSEIGDGLHSTPIYSSNGEYFFINGNNIYNGQIVITENTKAVNISEFKKHKNDLGNKTILLSINGTIGNLALFEGEKVILGKSAAYLNTKNNLERKYIYYSLQTKQIALQFNNGLTGTTIKNLGLSTIRNTKIPLPTLKSEQSAIATALSDTDTLIEKLEKLIEKKKNIKQGAMQELLTVKRRLPGFSGKWETKRLGEMCELKNGYAFKSFTYTDVGEYKIITIANVQDGFMDSNKTTCISKLPSDIQEHQQLKFGDLLISMTGNVGRVCFVDNDISLLNQRVGKIETSTFDKGFIFYICSNRTFLNSMILKAVGGAQGNLGKSDILEYETKIPVDPKEQTAIANVLSDMDTEIEKLESQLTKYQNLKQGMMQTLLTGKIRLI